MSTGGLRRGTEVRTRGCMLLDIPPVDVARAATLSDRSEAILHSLCSGKGPRLESSSAVLSC